MTSQVFSLAYLLHGDSFQASGFGSPHSSCICLEVWLPVCMLSNSVGRTHKGPLQPFQPRREQARKPLSHSTPQLSQALLS